MVTPEIEDAARAVIADPRVTPRVRRLIVEWDDGPDWDTTAAWSTCLELGLHEKEPGEDHALRHTELGAEVARLLRVDGSDREGDAMILTHVERRALAAPLWSRRARRRWSRMMAMGLIGRSPGIPGGHERWIWNLGKWHWTDLARRLRVKMSEGNTTP